MVEGNETGSMSYDGPVGREGSGEDTVRQSHRPCEKPSRSMMESGKAVCERFPEGNSQSMETRQAGDVCSYVTIPLRTSKFPA